MQKVNVSIIFDKLYNTYFHVLIFIQITYLM